MTTHTELAGAKETREALQELTKTVQRNVGRRALRVSAQIIASATEARAPVSSRASNRSPGSLKQSVDVVPHRSKVGAAIAVIVKDVAAVPVEFGLTNRNYAAQPFFRPAISASESAAIAAFEAALKQEVEAAAARAAKRSAKAK